MPLIPANLDQSEQAFYNLIKNAVQALTHGGILRVTTSRSDTHLQVSFEDNGTGISVEDMAHITEPYFTRKKGGTGLGLFIVQRILHEHGGHLELLSEPGRGTTARILLPLAERRVRLLGSGAGRRTDRVEAIVQTAMPMQRDGPEQGLRRPRGFPRDPRADTTCPRLLGRRGRRRIRATACAATSTASVDDLAHSRRGDRDERAGDAAGRRAPDRPAA